jgi:medium-chain acyl-[acyl-carrier-protein] hydrolase
MEKSSIWKESFKVRSYHMDMNASATVMSIAGYLQEAAGNHANFMNFGFKDMKETGLVWVLTRVKIIFNEYPKWGDEIEVSTWVVNAEKFFSRRDFEIKDKSGKVLISSISGWMLVQAKEKRPHSVDEVKERFVLMPERKSIDKEIRKIDGLSNIHSSSFYRVKYSDIDIVGHMNNIQYYQIILDSLPFQFRKARHITSFEINYLAEALAEEELEIQSEQLTGDNEYKYEIKRVTDQKTICRALVNFAENK